MDKKVVFSGIQPSGNLHIGNYIGALKQWVEGQGDLSTGSGLNIFCIVDQHAITVPQDPAVLREKSMELAGIYLAAGIDPKKSLVFVQSHNPDHTALGWVLNCNISMGQLGRMTQYKEKSAGKESVSVGLFDYPALMAADILLYDTTEVPVGDDQKQHVELTRDVAERFNSKYGQTFVLPTPVIPKVGARIMSLAEPTKKMSKSEANPYGAIGLLDGPDVVKEKIARAVTDSERDIRYDIKRPGVYNLIEIYAQLAGMEPKAVEEKFVGKGYAEFKKDLTEVITGFLQPFQTRYSQLRESGELEEILKTSAQKAREISHKKLEDVYRKIGFVTG